MTDPNSAQALRGDPKAGRVIDEMWALDPDPAASVALWNENRRAVETGGAVVAKNAQGQPLGFYFCTPYWAIYEARRPLVIGDTPTGQEQRFTFERAAEGVCLGYPYKREIVVGNFQTGADIDYCGPDQPPPHDEQGRRHLSHNPIQFTA